LGTLAARWSAFVDQQHQHPRGLVGRFIGERMRQQHAPETNWSVELLGLQPSDRVLEIGFGAGRGLALCLRQSLQGHVTGIDLSATMVQAARRRNRTALLQRRLALLRGDFAHLPFKSAQFDKLFSIHTLYFWPDPSLIFQQCLALLKPGGRLVVTCATAHMLLNGEWEYWPIHHQVESLVRDISHHTTARASLVYGPNSRQFNNLAIVVDRST
jgi:ubiquinone/menaquinone biosynthesis C-methylase UbiE